jgi:hypothetical protein
MDGPRADLGIDFEEWIRLGYPGKTAFVSDESEVSPFPPLLRLPVPRSRGLV